MADSGDHKDIVERFDKKLTSFMNKAGDEFLPWKERIRKEGVEKLWNSAIMNESSRYSEKGRKDYLERWSVK